MGMLRAIYLSQGSRAASAWDHVVTNSFSYDFYHLSAYHLIAQARGEGNAVLLTYEDAGYSVSLPLLLRPVAEVEGLGDSDWWDATSVYGFAGPLYSHPELPNAVLSNFQEAIGQYLREIRVVSVFSRLHPLIPQEHVLRGLGLLVDAGTTVSIDITIPLEHQRMRYRRDHKYNINRLRRLGWQGTRCQGIECEGVFLDEFIEAYWENMDRIGAKRYYYFDRAYFSSLLRMSGVEVWIFAARLNNEIGAAGIFTLCNGVVQYHLSGTKTRFLKDAPMKLVLDEVRLWANDRGAKVFHLGGGLGGREDSLFSFKAGFSDRRHRFVLWRWVTNESAYRELCERKREWNQRHEVVPVEQQFFPEYRSPVSPRESALC